MWSAEWQAYHSHPQDAMHAAAFVRDRGSAPLHRGSTPLYSATMSNAECGMRNAECGMEGIPQPRQMRGAELKAYHRRVLWQR